MKFSTGKCNLHISLQDNNVHVKTSGNNKSIKNIEKLKKKKKTEKNIKTFLGHTASDKVCNISSCHGGMLRYD